MSHDNPQIAPPQIDHTPKATPSGPTDERFFRPMLSAKLPCAEKNVPTEEEVLSDLRQLNWSRGFLASPKLDGIRAVKGPEGLVTRTLKLVPNKHIQKALASESYHGLDGELIIGSVSNKVNYNDSQSGIMSRDGEPYFSWCVFDDVTVPDNAFWWRHEQAKKRIEDLNSRNDFHGLMELVLVEHKKVSTPEELLEYETEQLSLGYEGIMFRDPGGRYKSFPSNRSTFKQQGLIKLKRFVDGEAEIVGFEELYRNTNEQFRDDLGYAKRSAHLSGQVGAGTLGKLLVRGINGRFRDTDFSVGSGLDETTRAQIWGSQDHYHGKIIKYKFQDAGAKNKPRSPIFLGFRDPSDL